MYDLKAICAELQTLGGLPPTPERRLHVEKALQSKFEGVQSVAAQVLAQWADQDSVQLLKRWFQATSQQRPYGIMCYLGLRLLVPHITSTDTEWLLALFFSLVHVECGDRTSFIYLLRSVDHAQARDEVLARARSTDLKTRDAALAAIDYIPFPDKKEWVLSFLTDREARIRDHAEYVLEKIDRESSQPKSEPAGRRLLDKWRRGM